MIIIFLTSSGNGEICPLTLRRRIYYKKKNNVIKCDDDKDNDNE